MKTNESRPVPMPFLMTAALICCYQTIVTMLSLQLIDRAFLWAFALYGFGQGLFSASLVKIRYVYAAFIGTLLFLIAVLGFFRMNEALQVFIAATTLALGSNFVLFYKLLLLQRLKEMVLAAARNQKISR